MGARGFAKPEAAAKAWGAAHGIINRGGSLYWDAESVEEAKDWAAKAQARLGVKPIYRTARGYFAGERFLDGLLVTGYGPGKGWVVLAPRLIARGRIEERDGRYFPVSAA